MKILNIIIFLSLCFHFAKGQSAEDYFHNSSKLYIDGKNGQAKDLLAQGMARYPNDPKLSALDGLIEEEEPEDQQNQDQQEQNQDQQNQDQQNQDQQDQEEQKGEEQQQQQQEGQENEQKEGEEEQQQAQQQEGEEGEEKENEQKPAPSPSDKLKEINISEEKARMILEALKNSEIQYIQQNRRKPTKRKESDKPDW